MFSLASLATLMKGVEGGTCHQFVDVLRHGQVFMATCKLLSLNRPEVHVFMYTSLGSDVVFLSCVLSLDERSLDEPSTDGP